MFRGDDPATPAWRPPQRAMSPKGANFTTGTSRAAADEALANGALLWLTLLHRQGRNELGLELRQVLFPVRKEAVGVIPKPAAADSPHHRVRFDDGFVPSNQAATMIDFSWSQRSIGRSPPMLRDLTRIRTVLRAHAEHLFKALHRNAAPLLESPARLVTTT